MYSRIVVRASVPAFEFQSISCHLSGGFETINFFAMVFKYSSFHYTVIELASALFRLLKQLLPGAPIILSCNISKLNILNMMMRLIMLITFLCSNSVVAITLPSHGKGPEFEPQLEHSFLIAPR